MLKLNWKESATSLPEFVREINEGNSFDVDNDFVIRCLFAVSDLGTKFDIDLLRKKANVTKLRDNFEQCCDAIRSTVDFVQTHCWCASSNVIGGLNTLIPIVYYLFHTKNHQVRNDQVTRVRKALYLISFAKPFSRYGESRVWAFIRNELRPLVKKSDETFPWENLIWWVDYWEKIRSFDNLLQANHVLALHLVQGLTGAAVKYERNAPEIDHIFPRSVLRTKGFDQAAINNFANFWILAKTKNQNKSNQHPGTYFENVDEGEMKAALIDREYLDYRRYTTFVSNRGQRMVERVKEKLDFQGDEFERSANEET
jgi:5-methylcytosine-specific restriction endonuclease McrA